MKNSITSENTKITYISDIIQKSRITLNNDNELFKLSSNDSRKIILCCLIYLCNQKKCKTVNNIFFSNILNSIGMPSNIIKFDYNINEHELYIKEVLDILSDIKTIDNWDSLINYAFEALEYDVDDYFSINIKRGLRSLNSKKKRLGIYYTPDDVVNFMVSRCLNTLTSRIKYPTILDCSCGSGLFILNCLEYLEKKYNQEQKIERSMHILQNCIWGIDISAAAIDCCKAAFIKYYIAKYSNNSEYIKKIVKIINNNFVVGDSTKLPDIIKRNDMLLQYDCIIGNPPYVQQGKSSNLYLKFVDNMIKFSSKQGFSALVVPLSICYSSGNEYINLRNRIKKDNATWEFMNFDRSPDSLFGDQVKTRNTILYRNANGIKALFTTKLQRWTAEYRNNLFNKIKLYDISDFDISKVIPKISDKNSALTFNIIQNNNGCLKDLLSSSGEDDSLLVMNGTAYNWICAYDHIPPSLDENGNKYKSDSIKKYYATDKEARDFCIAVLCNRIAYFYWLAEGDGFHLNSSFLNNYKVSKNKFTQHQYKQLSLLGKKYSSTIRNYPKVSYNAGKTIVNYSYAEAMDIVKQIEKIIIKGMKFPKEFSESIEKLYKEQVCCNRMEYKG